MVDDVVPAALTALVPFSGVLQPFARRMTRAVRAEHARRHSIALRAAERRSGLIREGLEAGGGIQAGCLRSAHRAPIRRCRSVSWQSSWREC